MPPVEEESEHPLDYWPTMPQYVTDLTPVAGYVTPGYDLKGTPGYVTGLRAKPDFVSDVPTPDFVSGDVPTPDFVRDLRDDILSFSTSNKKSIEQGAPCRIKDIDYFLSKYILNTCYINSTYYILSLALSL